MPTVQGQVLQTRVREEEGRTDWALAVSKLLWFLICVMFPLSCFRFLNDLFGPLIASVGIFLLLLLIRLLGPSELVMLDELLSRMVPSLRSAVRFGRVSIHDFRVGLKNGRQVAALLTGDLTGSAPMRGDIIRITGEFHGGTLHIVRGYNRTTQAEFAPRANHSSWVLAGTFTMSLVFGCYLWGAFDAWLYPMVCDWLDFLLATA